VSLAYLVDTDWVIDHFHGVEGVTRKLGLTVGDFDLLIAATCLCHGLTLCSNNRRHFDMVEGLEIFSVA
jgi:tRNA(fMet)-specific endonuclease VapC